MRPRARPVSVTTLTIALLAVPVALTAVVGMADTSSAHPVHNQCEEGEPGEVNPWIEEYLDQFDPADPGTWTNGIVMVRGSFGCYYIHGCDDLVNPEVCAEIVG